MSIRSILTPFTQIFEGVGIALEALRANKVRAGLTIMGVALGVFVVVAMSSVVQGINESFRRDIEAAGPTSFFVYRRPIGGFNSCDGTVETCPERRNPPITLEEVAAIQRLPNIRAVTSHVGTGAKFRYKDKTVNAGMEAYTANWTEVDGGDIYPGRNFSESENAAGARVILVNDKLAQNLFGDSDPIDKIIMVDDVQFSVIGLYHYTASPMGTPTSAGGGDSPKAIVPFEAARRHLNLYMRGNNLIVKPMTGVTVEEAVDDVTATLRGHRGLRPSQVSNFDIVTQDRLWSIYNQLFGTFFVVGLALSSVGLLVGGIGVIAIMMISVTERTREIGVRKALGATKWTILWQFLVEAVTLTGIGASVGLVLGILVAIGVRTAWPSIPATTSWSTVAASLGISAVTGIVFGMLPAIRAAKMDPVVALRYE
ncbi:MAG: ABC transporter permease [Gemmatimonadota bacterium]